jgi:CheY-like chemotaxis protein
MSSDIDRCFQSGMDAFIAKPIVIAKLVQALKECSPNIEKKTA